MNAILKFFGTILSFFSKITGGHYLFGLFLFALLIKIILLPFGIKQQKTSIKQARVRPKEMAIRKKYAGRTDRVTQQKMQDEIMQLYQREGYSPMSGCLPMLIQLPIIIILYNVIINPLKYICGWTAEQITNISGTLGGLVSNFPQNIARDIDLIQYLSPDKYDAINSALTESGLAAVDFSAIPNFSMGAFDLSAKPTWTSILVLVPILTFVFQFAAMKIQRKFTYQPMAQDQQQGANKMSLIIMDILFPAMTAWIAFTVPAAIGIYWAFNNILGVLQQIILFKAMPLPKFTEEDYKAAERELAGKAPKHQTESENRAPVRSLHTIDFSDEEVEEDLGDYVSVYDKPKEEKTEPTPENVEKKKKLFGKTKIKDDEKPSAGNKE
ncbi:MAG: YidC/Oxa1 family membrane protein insertase [Eubacteriales bacterium]